MTQLNRVEETGGTLYDDLAFEQLFKAHFKALHAYANAMLRDVDAAEEIVQNMFMRFWEKRELLNIQTSVKAYLYKCVHNDCLNLIKHHKIKLKYEDHTTYLMRQESNNALNQFELRELEKRLAEAMNELPQQCRTIFQLSRFEELKYREIAEQLNLSVKTVEVQMGKALRIMRLKLADFLPILFLWLLNNRNL
ncbi:MAG: RNA polymerase sigma-70 factor [Sphingobacteriaceae bacterium]|nr:RNA polymerase sigma-70 factor [Sphingobacteriaceae bacterium]